MTEGKDKYSLWIVPRGEAGERLRLLTNKLADENNAPRFVPHVTLVANIFATKKELKREITRIQECAGQLGTFTIKLTTFGYSNEDFLCLYLLAESPALRSVYEKIAACFPQVNDEKFLGMPHLSVLYGRYSNDVKKRIIEANLNPSIEFNVNSLELFITNNPIESWHLVESFPLVVGEN